VNEYRIQSALKAFTGGESYGLRRKLSQKRDAIDPASFDGDVGRRLKRHDLGSAQTWNGRGTLGTAEGLHKSA
jgi:hypothetical protein